MGAARPFTLVSAIAGRHQPRSCACRHGVAGHSFCSSDVLDGVPPAWDVACRISSMRTSAIRATNESRPRELRRIKPLVAMQRIASSDAQLGAHLEATVHTRTICVYTPDPRVEIAWRVTVGGAVQHR